MSNFKVEPSLLSTLEWRCIGPFRGGRTVAVAGHPTRSQVFFFGASSGGVWKSADGGTYWENVSDGFFNTAPVGAIAISDSDPNVIYVGTGEACIRGNVCHGDGVYRSTDGGRSWSHMGLDDSHYIARVRVHPQDPNLVYVAALGHAYGPNQQRGVFRSRDGGDTWDRVLFRSENAGAIDLSLDPSNPRVLYAALWDVRRTPWSLASGGPDSSIYKSTDGGDSWTEITDNPGLPQGLKGRIGIAVSPPMPNRVWAIVESKEGGLYRSDDAGDTWKRVTDKGELQRRPWYYNHVFADPRDPDTIWVMNLRAWKSVDGGRTFDEVTTPHGDNHDLWIDPNDPQRLINANDGGACVSFNGGETFSSIMNQPTAQFYHVTTDTRFPYRVYGSQQDNTSISVPSSSYKGCIPREEWYPVGNTESGYIAVRPDNPDIVFSGAPDEGFLIRYDHSTGQLRDVAVWSEIYEGWGAESLKYRFQWTYPIVISPHDPDVLYVGANHVFRSTDDGISWQSISPDLTRNDPDKLKASGGPITLDTTAVEFYCTLSTFAESPLQPGLLWAGSDDGLVHITQDGGSSWRNVTPGDLPEWSTITTIEPSRHDPATAFLTATRYKLDDYRPLIYRTEDYGGSWQSIIEGIPENDISRVIREDPDRKGLLYAGTESGVFVSFDHGVSWHSLRLDLPVVPIHDLAVKDQDLVAATHGRSFWILDDLTPLHQLTDEALTAPAHLFKPRAAYRQVLQLSRGGASDDPMRSPAAGKSYESRYGMPVTFRENKNARGETVRVFLDAGANPPYGLVVTYHLAEKPRGEVTLAFLDRQGQVITQISSTPADDKEPRAPAEAGMNRYVWDLRYPPARRVPGDMTSNHRITGITAPPGTYQVRLSVEGETLSQTFDVRIDPRLSASQQDLDQQFDLLIQVRDKVSETHDAINKIRSVRLQVSEWTSRAKGHPAAQTVSQAADGLGGKLSDIEDVLIQTRARAVGDTLNLPVGLNSKLAALSFVISGNDGVPTLQAHDLLEALSERIDVQIGRLEEVIDRDVPEFINLIHELDIPAILPRATA